MADNRDIQQESNNDIPAPKDIQNVDSIDDNRDVKPDVREFTKEDTNAQASLSSNMDEAERPKRPWYISFKESFKEPGSATQIVSAALVAIAIGLIVTTQVDEIPVAATEIISIPGDLWLRALQAVVLPLIICAMVIAVQRLVSLDDGTGGKLGAWTVGYYVLTTLIAITVSCILVGLVWEPRFTVVDRDAIPEMTSEQATNAAEAGGKNPPHAVVKQMFQSFIPRNVVYALANNELLAILITAMVLGYLLPSESTFLKIIYEIEALIMRIITFLIKLAPVGVFFLILPNLMKLPLSEIGLNLGYLIGGTLSTMALHLFIILPAIFFAFTRRNPYTFWFKCSPAWVTAWGTASSAATLPVTLRMVAARKVPVTVYKFAVPLGCLVNMDGTAIYFPMAVIFLAATTAQELFPTDYVIICLLATLASIGTTPIPSSSLVLVVMIANSVGIEVTGMFAVIVTIDWFLDRFRTAVNVSGDLFAAQILADFLKIVDPPGTVDETMLAEEQRRLAAEQRV